MAGMPGDLPEKPKTAIPPELVQAEQDMDILIAKTFNSTAGRKTWEWLKSITIEQHVLSVSEGFSGIMMGYSREGQNALIRKIQKRMDRASNSGKK